MKQFFDFKLILIKIKKMVKLLRIIWLRHLPLSKEQFSKQALAFDARK